MQPRDDLARPQEVGAASDGLSETPGTIADDARRFAAQPLRFAPGAAWEYILAIDGLGRFLRMLLCRVELEGVRIPKAEAVDRTTSNRIGELAMPDWGHGDRFGYGVGVVAERGPRPEAVGSYSWGGFFYT